MKASIQRCDQRWTEGALVTDWNTTEEAFPLSPRNLMLQCTAMMSAIADVGVMLQELPLLRSRIRNTLKRRYACRRTKVGGVRHNPPCLNNAEHYAVR